VIGTGLFRALSTLNKVAANFTLNASGARSNVDLYAGQVISLAWLFGPKARRSHKHSSRRPDAAPRIRLLRLEGHP
jgi:hypothetical protein